MDSIERQIEKQIEKLEKSAHRFMSRLHLFIQKDRRCRVVIMAIGKLVAVGVTIYVVLYEFPLLSENVNFMMLLMTWGMYGLIVFVHDIRQAKEKTTGEKIDDLITEIKADREQWHTQLENLINEIRREGDGRKRK